MDTISESIIYNLRNDLARANRIIDAQAAEIERLRAALDEIADFTPDFSMSITWEEVAVKLVTIACAARGEVEG